MKVLVACEYSGIVRDAFLANGHDAISCDLLPTESKGPHYQGDVFDIIEDGYDLLIAHPPCTYLCNSGYNWLFVEEGRIIKMGYAIEFFKALLNCKIPKKAIENHIQHKIANILIKKRYSQIIQPYHFGHPESKAICLWLENLPKLKHTNDVSDIWEKLPNKEKFKNHYISGKNRGKERSKFFPNVAKAMADQWGNLNNKPKGFNL